MLKLRILSAIILIPLVIFGILYLPNLYVAILSGIFFAVGAWEWLHMTVLKNSATRFVLLILLIFLAANLLYAGINTWWVYWIALCGWVVGLIGVCYYPRGSKVWQYIFWQPVVGLILFVPGWLAFNSIHKQPNGPIWVLLGCFLIWGADIGAYAAGRIWGKEKLVPSVSPNKTWAGVYGAFIFAFIIMTSFWLWFRPGMCLAYALWLAAITVTFAIIGDLVESMLKRVYGFKDSGKLIPGHGGVFDRIDSMLAAFPIYYLGLQIVLSDCIMPF